tara:strand:- start:20732 stop:21838 length:1107 start_codon:yes stop_codon:yes gene_type:complete
MNILFVSRAISPPWDEVSKNLIYGIVSRIANHSFYVMGKRKTNIPIDIKNKNITYIPVYTENNMNFLQKVYLIKELLSSKDDIDLSHFMFSPSFFCSYLLKKLVTSKYSVQNIPFILKQNFGKTYLNKILFGNILVVNSEYTKERIKKITKKNIRRINIGIDTDKFKPMKKSARLLKELEISSQKIVLHCGYFSQFAVLENILHVIPQVIKKVNTVFMFAIRLRERNDYARLKIFKKLIKEYGLEKHLRILGNVSDMAELINLCDISIFPVQEMLFKVDTPMVLLEALSMEKPIIITDIPPLNEIMVEDIGLKILPGSKDALSDAIIELLLNNERRRSMGILGRKAIKEFFNVEKMVLNYQSLYSEFR